MTLRSLVRIVAVPAAAVSLFACGGSQSMPAGQGPAPAGGSANMAAPEASRLPAGVSAEMVAAGDSLFNAPKSCNGCHGKGGVDGRNGPNLTTGKYEHIDGSYASIVNIVTGGIPKDSIKHPEHRFPMRPRGGHDYTDEQIRNLAAYVWTLGRKS
ncbi:MAG TPA: c-type cytochrome [Gemmatimonadaceae bacterium]|nr:c-type cytochrome [Gemmatimonadaceae bacterium]